MTGSLGLPDSVDPFRLAAKNGIISGRVALAGMHRLRGYLLAGDVADNANAQLELRFFLDSQKRAVITGELSARLELQCQRCMSGLEWPIDSELKLVAVSDDDAASQVPREYEPLMIGPEGLIPEQLAEDELILALPVIARCDDESCPRAPQQLAAGESIDNPFAALRDMDFDDNTTD